MADIYRQHESAFSRVSAYVITKDGERVANVAFKYPADGAGRLYAYVHWFGIEMVRGFAAGGGYDKPSAATYSAAKKPKIRRMLSADALRVEGHLVNPTGDHAAFWNALAIDDGHNWDSRLRDAGFTVLQAV
jgi:hypothetical protein